MPRTLEITLTLVLEDYPKIEIDDLAKNAMDCAPADMITTDKADAKLIAEEVRFILATTNLEEELVNKEPLTAFSIKEINVTDYSWRKH